MRFITTAGSDVGIVKKVNQDAISVKMADTAKGKIVFAIICDGMGGFEQGEFASASVVHAYGKWFEESFLSNLNLMDDMRIKWEWETLAHRANRMLSEYGEIQNIKIGTTLNVLLIYNNHYCVMNVGDCRLYQLDENIVQVTRDHSWVARQVELGKMTKDEARLDSRNNRLLQCIGAMGSIEPDFYVGDVKDNDIFMMCCDGVRNKVSDEELFYLLHPSCMVDESVMKNNLLYIFELNKLRNERDNMSMILIRAVETTAVIYDEDNEFEAIIEKDITFMESKNYLEI